MERRHRRTKREKMEDELRQTEEAIEQYKAAIATMEEKSICWKRNWNQSM